MVTFTRFFLLSFPLLSHVYADDLFTNEAVLWIEAERSVLVRLATPDLSFLGKGNQRDEISTNYPATFIFNFTLAPDNLTLLMNNEPILPRAHRYIPTPLRAHQMPDITRLGELGGKSMASPVMDLDYYIKCPDTTSATSIWNTKYNPRLTIDILSADMPNHPGYSAPLSSNSQNKIWVWLEDLSEHTPGTLYSSIPLKIRAVNVGRRWRDADSKGTTTYKSRKSLKTCYIWSWLCADINEYPYYQFIYRENFDQYGKKGSMRHFLTRRWDNLVNKMGVGRAIVLLVVCGSMILSPFVYAVFRGIKSVVGVYQKRIQDVDEWVADEEVEGLLQYDRYLENFRQVEKEEVTEGKGDEKTSVEESFPAPPYIPVKVEKS